MGIQNWSDDIILVNLAPEPQMGEELSSVINRIESGESRSVVVDFGQVSIVTSSSIAKLLKLRQAITEHSDCKLILSSASSQTKKIFQIAGLESVFEFVDDQFFALAGLQMTVAD
jgi:anti-anti-sigma factor